MINAMDEEKVRRMMGQGSLQEVLWQVGSLPGAVVPTDHEIYLEYEGPRAPQAPAAAPRRRRRRRLPIPRSISRR